MYTKKPDVVCLCETWLKRREPRFIGYKALWDNRPNAPKGGLDFLIREDIGYNKKTINFYAGGVMEIAAITVCRSRNNIDILNCYNPGRIIE